MWKKWIPRLREEWGGVFLGATTIPSLLVFLRLTGALQWDKAFLPCKMWSYNYRQFRIIFRRNCYLISSLPNLIYKKLSIPIKFQWFILPLTVSLVLKRNERLF